MVNVKQGRLIMETVGTTQKGQKVNPSPKKSRSVLTAEEADFFKLIRLRATSVGVGQPYIASAIFRLIPVSSPGLQTMGVDKFWRCYIDFDFMMEKGVEYAAGVLAHEPWHLLRDHNSRAEKHGATESKYPPLMWNIAGDLEINDDIKTLVPEDSLFPETGEFHDYPEGEMAEHYFDRLVENMKCSRCSKPVFQTGDNSQDSSNDDSDGSGSDQKGETTDNSETGDSDSSDKGNGNGLCECPSKVKVQCGSGAGNSFGEYELSEEEADSVDADEHNSIKTIVAEEVKKQERSNPGSVPGHVALWADAVLTRKPVSWKQVLRGEVKKGIAWKRGKTDYYKKRPSRRQPVKDVIYPALRSPSPRIAIAVDTSASNVHNLGAVLSEIEAIVKQVGIRGRDLLVFSVDFDAKGNLTPVNDVKKISFEGGGGTDMRVAYNAISEINPKVDIGIVITDGETPWPETPVAHSIKFITVLMVDQRTSWGETVISDAENALSSWGKVIVTNDALVE